jgi:branched-chain amino acid transport system ATP-binding protein
LLRAIAGQKPIASGSIRLGDADITGLPMADRVRSGIAYLPAGHRIFPGLTVRDTLEMAAFASSAERRRRRATVLDLFPQLGQRLGERAWRLSGGQQQMLALGRALMAAPKLLLLDSPSAGLAPVAIRDLYARLRAIAADGAAIVLFDQDAPESVAAADRLALFAERKLIAAAPRARIEAIPAHRDWLRRALGPMAEEGEYSPPFEKPGEDPCPGAKQFPAADPRTR